MLQSITDCIRKRESFAFETTLSGKKYASKIKLWKQQEYSITIYYLKLPSVEFAIERVKLCVSQGGHNIPEPDIRRRFELSWTNFQNVYKPLADAWTIFDTTAPHLRIIDESE